MIQQFLDQDLRLTKVRKLLRRQNIEVSYATLRRFAVTELGFGRRAPTVAVADCGPGEELQFDTGWMTYLEPDLSGKRRRFRAWIFTSVLSRYRFVYPVFRETTQTAIEACEAAWQFFGGIFHALIVDNTKAIVARADPLRPRIVRGFLEYAQLRGFVVDTTRARRPRDKARVERAVPTVRDDCFAGEKLRSIEDARVNSRATGASTNTECGVTAAPSACRCEHFEAEERSALLPAPTEAYDIPAWSEPKVARDQYAQVAKALYSLPTKFVGQKLEARADRTTVRFYLGATLVKTHPRVAPGQRSTDPNDFPPEKTAYALRDVAFLARQARGHGEAVGQYASALLEGTLPWTRMRQVYALLGLARRYGSARLEAACRIALDVDMVDVHRLRRLLEVAATDHAKRTRQVVSDRPLPAARHSVRLPLSPQPQSRKEKNNDCRCHQSGSQDRASPAEALPPCSTPCPSASLSPDSRRCPIRTSCCSSSPTRSPAATAWPPSPGPSGAASIPTPDRKLGRDRQGHLRPRPAQRTRLAALPRAALSRRHRRPRRCRQDLPRPRPRPHRLPPRPLGACAGEPTEMLKTLKHARLTNSHEAELRKLLAVDLLIIDDFGLDAMDVQESRDAYEIFTERHRAGSMVVTSNRGPDEWLATFADPIRAQSAIDRFTCNAYDLVIEGESYRSRLKPSLKISAQKDPD